MKKLSPSDEAFVAAYDGNAIGTLRRIGRQGTDVALKKAAERLMKRPEIAEAIKARELREARPAIWDRRRRQEFWTAVASNEKEDTGHRLRASELLGKSEADFTDNVNLSGTVSHEAAVAAAMRKRRGAS